MGNCNSRVKKSWLLAIGRFNAKNFGGKMKFSDYMRRKRLAANLSQGDLAKILGYRSNQFISNWERGEAFPPVYLIDSLAKILSVRTRELKEQMVAGMCEARCEKLRERLGLA